MGVRVLYASSEAWAGIGERLDEMLAGSDFRPLKKTSHTLAGIGRVNGTEVFVKRVETRSWSKGIAARVRGSRAKQALHGADLLRQTGFAYPKPIAAFERVRIGALEASYTLAEVLRRPRILSRFALADGRDFSWRLRLSREVAETIRRLHQAGCYTRDLQETNLMVEAQGDSFTVYFIDLEDFRRRRKVSSRRRMLNLIHLDRSIGRFLSRAQRLRFLYCYLGRRPDRSEARDIVRHLYRMTQRIERRKFRARRAATLVTPIIDTSADIG
jgi:tRNA A-37 threonylcarbamoyl transferase component Bud32